MYLRTIHGADIVVNLLQAITKVSPIKPLLTIPRLELCAAALLANLTRKVCISRGLKPSDLLSYQLWWQGPEWLTSNAEPYATTSQTFNSSMGTNSCCTSNLVSKGHLKPVWDLLERFSNVQKLLRVTAHILRFLGC